MSFSIQTNVNSLLAQENLRVTNDFQSLTIQRLTSGYRINQSGDDAAGLAIANKFRSDIAELSQGVRNANDGISTLQIIDGGMNNIAKMLERLRTLATQSASQTFTGDRSVVNSEFQGLLSEIDRQAKSIGLDTGGLNASTLGVYIGGGRDSAGAVNTANGMVDLDLTQSVVDARGLGLKGMQAVTGTADIGTTSDTSVANIVGDATNVASESTPGSAVFYLSGPGFADSSKIAVSVNLGGVTDAASLATAINAGIQNAANGTTAAATAFKNAGVVASVNTTATGTQQLAFTSSTVAFQVQAGDRMSNAMMGQFSTGATGASLATAVTGQAAAATGTATGTSDFYVKISGAGMASPVTLTVDHTTRTTIGTSLTSATTTAIGYLVNQVNNVNTALQAAGITLSQNSAGQLVFTNSRNEQFSVEVTGDAVNKLGLGAFQASATTTADYTTILAGANYASAVTDTTVSGQATMEFSINGAPSVGIAGISLAGGDATAAHRDTTAVAATNIVTTGINDALTFSVDGNAVNAVLAQAGTAAVSTASGGLFAVGAPGVVIAAGTNDLIHVTIDGGGTKEVQLAAATYDSTTILAAVGVGLTAAGLAASVTASLDGSGNLVLTSNTKGTSSVVAIGDASKADRRTVGLAAETIIGTAANDALTFQVDGVDTVNVVLALAGTAAAKTGTGPLVKTDYSGANDAKLVISVDGLGQQTIVLNAAYADVNAVKTAINTQINALFGSAVAVASLSGGTTGTLSITSATLGSSSMISVGDGGGTTDALTGLLLTATSVFGNRGATASEIAAEIQTQANTQLGVAGHGASVAVSVSGGQIVIMNNREGSASHAVGAFSGTAVAGGSLVKWTTAGLANGTALITKLGLTAATQTGTAGATAAEIADQIQTQANTQLTGTGASVVATVDVGGQIVLTNGSAGASHLVSALTGTAVTSADPVNLAWAAAAASTLGTNRTGDSMASAINQELAANTTLAAAGLEATFGGGKLTIDSTNGTAFRLNAGAAPAKGTAVGTVDLTSGMDFTSSPMTLKVSVDGAAATTVTLDTQYANATVLAAAINSQLTGATASMVAINGKQYVEIQSVAGAAHSVQIESGGTANTALGFTDNTVHSGSAQIDIGFGVTGSTSAATLGLAEADSALSVVNASGTAQTGALSFAALASGDTQALTISAVDTAGVTQSITITLAGGAGTPALGNAHSGDNIDQAVSYINSQLQKSNNATVQSIVAVKETVGGQEEINFVSSAASFLVGIGSAVTGEGVNEGVAKSAASALSGAASTISVVTLSGALAAAGAIASAIGRLGSAQAAVGKGQNQLNYAVGLAKSQINNFSAAESRIRDADVAAEAANLTKAQVLQQASIAAMAQANSAPQAVLALLRG